MSPTAKARLPDTTRAVLNESRRAVHAVGKSPMSANRHWHWNQTSGVYQQQMGKEQENQPFGFVGPRMGNVPPIHGKYGKLGSQQFHSSSTARCMWRLNVWNLSCHHHSRAWPWPGSIWIHPESENHPPGSRNPKHSSHHRAYTHVRVLSWTTSTHDRGAHDSQMVTGPKKASHESWKYLEIDMLWHAEPNHKSPHLVLFVAFTGACPIMSSAFSTSNAIDKLLWTGCVLDTLGALPKESSRPATGAHSNYAVLLQTFF